MNSLKLLSVSDTKGTWHQLCPAHLGLSRSSASSESVRPGVIGWGQSYVCGSSGLRAPVAPLEIQF